MKPVFRPEHLLKVLLKALLMMVFGLLFPSWWLARKLLASYLPLDKAWQPDTLPETLAYLTSLKTSLLVSEVLPGILLCLSVSLLFGWVFGRLAQMLIDSGFNALRSGTGES
jgi:hypothetical protein